MFDAFTKVVAQADAGGDFPGNSSPYAALQVSMEMAMPISVGDHD
jgi:hypothetical protein